MSFTKTYTTQVQFGGDSAEWRPSDDLTIELSIHDGKSFALLRPLALSWREGEGAGGTVTIALTADAETFSGQRQNPGEGPISYRGSLKK